MKLYIIIILLLITAASFGQTKYPTEPPHNWKIDEHDKDVANAIRYAVDNGAQVINKSLGKYLSPLKTWVDDAMKYAEQKGALLIAEQVKKPSWKRIYKNEFL
jgi:hypothetical protein